MSPLDWVTVLVVLLVGLAWYLSYSAARLDRLHARVEATSAALDAQLVRRAESTIELANTGRLDAASGLILAAAAVESLGTSEGDADRESVESNLSDALALALPPEVLRGLRATDDQINEALARVAASGTRVQLARRFHNDAVVDVRRIRRKTFVRWFRLAGHADLPATIEFDDELPSGLRP
ncbi:hypothetical protein [Lapillicoccus sp.]|uniref:hypothetical protein n=1 Tax=Lapillicoccus sp. TaxID=1909287 RepID=UPI003263EDB4